MSRLTRCLVLLGACAALACLCAPGAQARAAKASTCKGTLAPLPSGDDRLALRCPGAVRSLSVQLNADLDSVARRAHVGSATLACGLVRRSPSTATSRFVCSGHKARRGKLRVDFATVKDPPCALTLAATTRGTATHRTDLGLRTSTCAAPPTAPDAPAPAPAPQPAPTPTTPVTPATTPTTPTTPTDPSLNDDYEVRLTHTDTYRSQATLADTNGPDHTRTHSESFDVTGRATLDGDPTQQTVKTADDAPGTLTPTAAALSIDDRGTFYGQAIDGCEYTQELDASKPSPLRVAAAQVGVADSAGRPTVKLEVAPYDPLALSDALHEDFAPFGPNPVQCGAAHNELQDSTWEEEAPQVYEALGYDIDYDYRVPGEDPVENPTFGIDLSSGHWEKDDDPDVAGTGQGREEGVAKLVVQGPSSISFNDDYNQPDGQLSWTDTWEIVKVEGAPAQG